MSNYGSFDASTPAEDVAAHVDRIKSAPEPVDAEALTELLAERNPVFTDKSTGTAARVRGYAMAAFEQTGLPDRAVPYVLDVLENSFHPYLVAAAARALRGMPAPDPLVAPYLLKAIYNVWQHDEPISFSSYHLTWPLKEYSTAVTEVFATLAWMGPAAQAVRKDLASLLEQQSHRLHSAARRELAATIDAIPAASPDAGGSCCGGNATARRTAPATNNGGHVRDLAGLVLEDQDGQHLAWSDFFQGRLAVLAFFYTRCANPRKCTQTIYSLVDLQRRLDEAGLTGRVRTAAITYDPEYDTAPALRSYGDARRFRFDEDHRMFRVPEDFALLVEGFELGVNFTGSQVNQHRIELYILDATGAIRQSFLRMQFEPEEVLSEVSRLLAGASP